jgi:hypothetical protein
VFPQAVFKNNVTRGRGQHKRSTRAKGDKKIRIGLLEVWKASAVSVFGKR